MSRECDGLPGSKYKGDVESGFRPCRSRGPLQAPHSAALQVSCKLDLILSMIEPFLFIAE